MENQRESYKTHDFYLGCVLMATNVKLLRIEKGGNKFVDFVFDTSRDEAEKIIGDYWGRNLQIEAKDLIEAISSLKTRIYSGV